MDQPRAKITWTILDRLIIKIIKTTYLDKPDSKPNQESKPKISISKFRFRLRLIVQIDGEFPSVIGRRGGRGIPQNMVHLKYKSKFKYNP